MISMNSLAVSHVLPNSPDLEKKINDRTDKISTINTERDKIYEAIPDEI